MCASKPIGANTTEVPTVMNGDTSIGALESLRSRSRSRCYRRSWLSRILLASKYNDDWDNNGSRNQQEHDNTDDQKDPTRNPTAASLFRSRVLSSQPLIRTTRLNIPRVGHGLRKWPGAALVCIRCGSLCKSRCSFRRDSWGRKSR